ncbi:MAG: TatD family hydrolase [Methylibium sp.]|nr:TatD family hydrolase [Methylibium sp.]
MPTWTDTHCHLDAAEFDADRAAVVTRARAAGVAQIVLPAIAPFDFETVRSLAHEHGLVYALGIHPLCVGSLDDTALQALRDALAAQHGDPRLVAVGEIGLDHFVAGLDRSKQEHFYVRQLEMAREFDLPVLLHVRRSADTLLKHLRRMKSGAPRGIAHAFNGSRQQADAFIGLGFKLGFGGAMTFDTALQLRRLAAGLPLEAIVMETDSPDIPPHWLYTNAARRAAGEAMGRNEPGELPRIAGELAALRDITVAALATATQANARAALPRLAALEAGPSSPLQGAPGPAGPGRSVGSPHAAREPHLAPSPLPEGEGRRDGYSSSPPCGEAG